MEIFPGIFNGSTHQVWEAVPDWDTDRCATVVGALAAGESFEGVEEAYQLTHAQVLVALRYAAHVSEHVPPGLSRHLENSSG